MRSSPRSVGIRLILALAGVIVVGLTAALILPAPAIASAYNGRPKLVVVIVIDQFRGDYLERYRDQFGDAGFRLFLDHGAYFTDCNYNYANTRTAPGHATLFTGAYSNGHGIVANEWWDTTKKRMVTSVEDDAVKILGIPGDRSPEKQSDEKRPGASPHNLMADTLGDELKLATQGKTAPRFCRRDSVATQPTGSIRRAAPGSALPTTGATCRSGCRTSTPATAPRNTGIATGEIRKERFCAPPLTAKRKTGQTPASTKSSAPPPSPTSMNSTLRKN
jgi:hypothetical protein